MCFDYTGKRISATCPVRWRAYADGKTREEAIANAAEVLGVTLSRISALIESGRLESKTFDGRRMVSIASVEKYAASPRCTGRPAKTK